MAYAPKILAFAGSTRNDSFNKKLVRIAAAGARSAGAQVDEIDLRDFPLPIYDGDLEAREGFSANVRKLKDLFESHDGFLISSPEYNSGTSAVLKNAIDWVSRPEPSKPPLSGFTGRVAGLLSASPGNLGGLRGLVHLRMILGNIGVIVVPEQVAVPKANDALDAEGKLRDAKQHASVEAVGASVAKLIARIRA